MKKLILFLSFPLLLLSFCGFEEPWGENSDLYNNQTEKTITTPPSFLTKVADKVITFKQKYISPVDGPRSNFRPTSSRYMQLAMKRYGFFKGYIMGCDRLLRENDEKWVYKTITIDGMDYKFDPAVINKYKYPLY